MEQTPQDQKAVREIENISQEIQDKLKQFYTIDI
ncbi:MAG: hypothetical protein IRF12RH_08175 (plasmid) [Rickettsia helvetica]|uniref:Uncharacterized protein n=1 Tax=Rickettsia helvetica TaxID=35789 RepID=A0ABM9NDS6_RICHE